MNITEKYTANPVPVWICAGEGGCKTANEMDTNTCSSCSKERQKGYWNYNRVEIFRNNEDGSKEKVGEYTRTYSVFYNTFHPFIQDDKEYALISHQYTGTCVISLPSCEHVSGECEWKDFGFCPTGFYVPENVNGQIGFVCGCVWGDDSGGWKLQFLDLSKLSEGKFTNEARFGYLELPTDISGNQLHEAIEVDYEGDDDFYIHINKRVYHRVSLETERKKDTIDTLVEKAAKRLFALKDNAEVFDKTLIKNWIWQILNEIEEL